MNVIYRDEYRMYRGEVGYVWCISGHKIEQRWDCQLELDINVSQAKDDTEEAYIMIRVCKVLDAYGKLGDYG